MAPERSNVPAPVLVRLATPEITPVMLTEEPVPMSGTSSVELASRVMFLAKVRARLRAGARRPPSEVTELTSKAA